MGGHDVYREEMAERKGFQPVYSTDSLGSHDFISLEAPRPRGRAQSDEYLASGWQDWPGLGRSGRDSIPVTPLESGATTPSPYVSGFSYRSQQSLTTLVNTPPPTLPILNGEYSTTSESIVRLHERDDGDIWKGWRRMVFKVVPLLAFTNTILYLGYLGIRIACVILAQRASGIAFPGAWIFLAIEIAIAVPSQMHNFWTMWAMKKRNRPKLRLRAEEVPTVDVFVTCCGEDDEVVMDTVRAACDVDYPSDRFRVTVLDDGASLGLAAAVGKLGAARSNLYYRSREKIPGVPHHFKAGNLNYGLEQVDLMPGGAGEFMAALDADMLFYNTPSSDPLAQSLNFFVHVIEPIKDSVGVAWCTGSGYIIRREALTEIGNFPLGSLAEDVATSTLMLGKGWKTGYIHEPLQYGTVPEDYGGHLKQRTRWAIGTIQTAKKLNFCLWGENVRKMTIAQRFSGFLYATLSLFTILVTLSLFAIPIVLLWGKPLIAYVDDFQLKWLIRSCFAAFMCNRVCEFALFSPAGYNTGQRDSRYHIWMSPYLALSIVRSFLLPRWLGGEVVAFKPTGSLSSALNERDPTTRKGMLRRMWAILFNFMAIFHFLFVYCTLSAIVITSYRCFFREAGFRNIAVALITYAFWPPLTFLFYCSSLWTPVAYAIDPPAMPDREELLDRDDKTGVAHPTAHSKKIAFGGQAAWFEFLYTASTMYTALVFAYSFFL